MTSQLRAEPPLSAVGLTKRYGAQLAVDDLTFAISAGRITGFLGPNGAGKTTTLRMTVGLITPTAGEVRVFGFQYHDLPEPATQIGTLIEATGFHPGRRARHELAIHAASTGIDDRRIPEVLAQVGLEAAADKRVGQLSLGMRQRLGLAAAILGEPRLLLLDEPANGLDPAGIQWLRRLLRAFAERGTAVLVSSHVLADLALLADDVVVLNHGRLVVHSPLADLVAVGAARVVVRTPRPQDLRQLIEARGGDVVDGGGDITITGLSAGTIGDLAAAAAIPLHQLRTETPTLERVFLDLTHDGEAIR